MIAESLASAGAAVASGYRRVAGVQLTINHLKAAPIGTQIFVSAKPVHAGKRLHVMHALFFHFFFSSRLKDTKIPFL
mgnify:CR=1 FL=1